MSKQAAVGMALAIGFQMACQQDVSVDKLAGVTAGTRVPVDIQAPDLSIVNNLGVPTTAHGMNFKILAQLDQAFCIAVDIGNTVGRQVRMEQCGTTDNQRWMLSIFNGETNNLIDNIGMCLDGAYAQANQGLAVLVQKCDGGGRFHFSYLPSGQIENVKFLKCLAITGAASGAPVFLDDCDNTKQSQKWALGH